MLRVTLQMYSRYPGSLYRCIHDVRGHLTGLFTTPRSLKRCIHGFPGHFTGVFTMLQVTLQVYSRYPGSLYRCIHDVPGHLKGVFKGGGELIVVVGVGGELR